VKDSSTATERVGRYQLLEPIGGGANGAVSRAKVFGVAGFERQFAVKRFIPELTVGALAQALSTAARSYGSLEHPRIARMSEFGVAEGQTFTAVEYVAGLDVFRLLQEAKLAAVAIAAGGALALVSQAARAVGYAHGRGLSHLGLSPTNVIVTADGDVKVTDFGILAATMPQHPAESQRHASRVPYLAPEQISGEATSAASDVFVLGVIAYELVTGQRAYRGDSPAQIASAILAGPPAEPPLPRPIVRVLQRCLARSPFERFPDARALADALDAALRVAPVPGTRKDVGAQVKTTLERYAALNEGNVSGMVALNLQGAPVSDHLDAATAIGVGGRGGRPEARTEPSPMPAIGRTPTPPPMPAIGRTPTPPPLPALGRTPTPQSASATMRDIPRPFTTMPGLAPPPIPVPPRVSPPPTGTPILPGSTHTIPGMTPGKKPIIPSIGPAKRPPPAAPPGPPLRPSASEAEALGAAPSVPSSLSEMSSEPVFSLSNDDANLAAADSQQTVLGLDAPPPPRGATPARPRSESAHNFDSATGEMSSAQLDMLNRRATLPTSDIVPLAPPPADLALEAQSVALHEANSDVTIQADSNELAETVATFATDAKQVTDDVARGEAESRARYESAPAPAPSPAPMRPSQPAMPMAPASAPPVATAPPAPSSTRMPLIAGIVLAVGVLGAGGYVAYNELYLKKQTATVVASSGSAMTGSAMTGSAMTGSAMAGSASQTGSGSSAGLMAGSAGSGAGSASGSADSGSSAASMAGSAGSDGSAAGSASGSAGSAGLAGSGSASGSGETGSNAGSAVAMATIDAGAGSASTDTTKPAKASDNLQVASKPGGARVFIDGADQGVAPVKVPGSADRHTLAVLLPGHELYLAEVDGQGVYEIALKPVTPTGGQAGIKVIKCKDKERYYVYVDGTATGMTCPTERIDTVIGPHVVEVYDIVTETRRKFDIVVKDERLSVRVKIEN
jgi:serine/threonine-protein kinase